MSPAAAILLAAGTGTRLGGGGPKGLVEVGGRSLVAWAVRALEDTPGITGFVLTIPAEGGDAVVAAAASAKLLGAVAGGARRQDSVRLGLAALPPDLDRVVCHDVARPFAGPELFSAVLAGLDEPGVTGVIPVVSSSDTVKRVRGGRVIETLDRTEVAAAQTPQAFLRAALEEAHALAGAAGDEATDDAAVLERAGRTVAVVPGDPDNFKITFPADLRRAEALAAWRERR